MVFPGFFYFCSYRATARHEDGTRRNPNEYGGYEEDLGL